MNRNKVVRITAIVLAFLMFMSVFTGVMFSIVR